MRRQLAPFVLLIVAFSLTVVSVGCSQPKPPDLTPKDNEQHILRVASLYGLYKNTHKGKGPATMDELKAWVKKMKPAELSKLKITDVEQTFTSPRDNQPYQLNDLRKAPGGMGGVLAYEKVGVNGKRMTVSSMGTTAELSEASMREAVPGFSG
jgi:hypothetical protein